MNRTLRIAAGVALLLIVAGASFYGGILYNQRQTQANFAARRAGAATGAGGVFLDPAQQPGQQRRSGAGFVAGQITAIENGVLTIAGANGDQTQVQVTDTTLIEKNTSVQLGDLEVGETVIVNGSAGDNNSITARSIQVAPAGRFGPGEAVPPG